MFFQLEFLSSDGELKATIVKSRHGDLRWALHKRSSFNKVPFTSDTLYYSDNFYMFIFISFIGLMIYIFLTTSRQMAVKCLVLRRLLHFVRCPFTKEKWVNIQNQQHV